MPIDSLLQTDIVIIGAGAAGLMCAIEAGKRNRKVIILDHANKPGKKILMSGGGRCNFTNYNINPNAYISHNPHFCKSALSRYTQWDFIELVQQYKIPFHEKTLGQLFCDNKAKDILNMLLSECEKVNVQLSLKTSVTSIRKEDFFILQTSLGQITCESLVIATGGLSIPTMGATPFAYKVAEQFGIKVWPTRAGLVPLTLHTELKDKLNTLSGISVYSIVSNNHAEFKENILFTHRGLSGPAILQISSYWQPGEIITINLLPNVDLFSYLKELKHSSPTKLLKNVFNDFFPKRVCEILLDKNIAEKKLATLSKNQLENLSKQFNSWEVLPNATEGYRTAEVTLGGVDCNSLSSKTMETHTVPGLYFIGEAIDVTGWLGGYNFQWAWSSAVAAGKVL